MKILFYDTETTGCDPNIHGIHQLAGSIVLNDEVVENFELKINPFKGCQTDNKSMEISKTSCLDLLKYQPEDKAFINFFQMIRKYNHYHLDNGKIFLAGWRNIEFDNKFLKAFFDRNTENRVFNSLFYSNSIDVKVLATQALLDERVNIPSFTLEAVSRYLGIDVEEKKLHKASYDAYLCRKVYEIVKQ